MMFLLSLLALAAPIDDTAYECSVKRADPALGSYAVSGVLPAQNGGPEFVSQYWQFRRGAFYAYLNWFSPIPGAPRDIETFGLEITGVPKGVDEARVELWRDGQRITEITGPWESMKGRGYREVHFRIEYGILRALGRGGPVMVVVVDREGEVLAKAPLPVEVIEAPVTLAVSTQIDYAELAAHAASRCPVYQEPDIVVT